jgi:hypothetical protein
MNFYFGWLKPSKVEGPTVNKGGQSFVTDRRSTRAEKCNWNGAARMLRQCRSITKSSPFTLSRRIWTFPGRLITPVVDQKTLGPLFPANVLPQKSLLAVVENKLWTLDSD